MGYLTGKPGSRSIVKGVGYETDDGSVAVWAGTGRCVHQHLKLLNACYVQYHCSPKPHIIGISVYGRRLDMDRVALWRGFRGADLWQTR
jgi:hypothetical protein